MSYTPTQWQTGDTITAEKLNHIEQGLFEAVDSIIIPNDKAEPFIVTFTPTAADFSGTMDKTVGEIYEAYTVGRQIRFRISAEGGVMEADCTARWFGNAAYPSFNGYIVNNVYGTIMFAYTGRTGNASKNTYEVETYALSSVHADGSND